MMKFLLLCLITLQGLYGQSLDLNKTSPHLDLHFSESDTSTVLSIIQDLEEFYTKISEEFFYPSHHSLRINIYPNVQAFHEALRLVDAPTWIVARATHDTIDIVSPSNPGPSHSKASIDKIIRLSIVKSIIFDKYGEDKVPYWLAFGIGALKVEYTYSIHYLKSAPSLHALETAEGLQFDKIGGFQASYLFAQFIQDYYGWDTLIGLLSNYDSAKNDLYQSWVDSLMAR